LDAAFYWGELKEPSPAFWAFRAFRNFDGKGGRFLDLSVPVQETRAVSLFASRDAATNHAVLVLVNQQLDANTTAEVDLRECGRVTAAQLYRFGADSKALAAAPSRITAEGVSAELEAASFAVLDLQLQR
jgi:hypothetical protein